MIASACRTPQALRRLEAHPWRDNVRELEAVIEAAMIFRRREWIGPDDLDRRSTSGAGDVVDPTDAEDEDVPAASQELSWLEREALRLAARRREVRRGELMRRFGISRKVAHRCLAALVRRGSLRLIGFGRGARYVPLSFWLAWVGDAFEWPLALV